MPRNKVGEAYVEVSADTAKLNAGVDGAKAKVQSVGSAGQEAGTKAKAGFDRAGEAASRLQKLLTRPLIAIATVAAVDSLIKRFSDLTRSADEFRQSIRRSAQDARQLTLELSLQVRQADEFEKLSRRASNELQKQTDALLEQRDAIERQRESFGGLLKEFLSGFSDNIVSIDEQLAAVDARLESIFRGRMENERLIAELQRQEQAKIAEQRQKDIEDQKRSQLEAIEEVRRAAEQAFSPLNQGSFAVGLQGLNDRLSDIASGLRSMSPVRVGSRR